MKEHGTCTKRAACLVRQATASGLQQSHGRIPGVSKGLLKGLTQALEGVHAMNTHALTFPLPCRVLPAGLPL